MCCLAPNSSRREQGHPCEGREGQRQVGAACLLHSRPVLPWLSSPVPLLSVFVSQHKWRCFSQARRGFHHWTSPGGSASCSICFLSPPQRAKRAMGTLATNTQGKRWKRARAAAPLLYIHHLLLPTAGEGIPQPHQGLASATAVKSIFVCCLWQLYLGAQENKHSCIGKGRL